MRHLPVVLLLLSGSALLIGGDNPKDLAPPMAIMVSVAPSTMDPIQLLKRKTPETYTCTAAVYQPGTHHAYAAAREIVAVPGKAQTSRRVSGEYEVEFSVDISSAADRARTRVTVRRNAVVVAEQRTLIMLPRSNGITPIQ